MKKKRSDAIIGAIGGDIIGSVYEYIGARHEDIKLFKQHIGPDVKIKAAGGIRTIEDALAYAKEGCSRIGSSKVAPLIAAKYNL